MSNFIEYNNNRYIESQNIKIFPCAYRGYYNNVSGETAVIDPEARSNTETNFTETFHKLSANKESYVVSWDKDNAILKCVIGGYYIEVYNHNTLEDWFKDPTGKCLPYYLCITTSPVDLGTDGTVDGDRKTRLLASFADTPNYLDIKVGTQYIFTGLTLKTEVEMNEDLSITAKLAPFIAEYHYEESGVVSEDNPQVGKYYKKNNTDYVKITASMTNPPAFNTQVYYRTEIQKLNPMQLAITSLLDTAEGNYSLRMIEDQVQPENGNSYFNTTVATGDYAVALGRHTEAAGLASTALGDSTKATGEGALSAGSNTTASGKYSLTTGNSTEAKADGAVALGEYTKATAANQVVIGKYNKIDADQAFIIANGTSSRTDNANKFTVAYNGDVTSKGKLNISGKADVRGEMKVGGAISTDSTLTTKGAITANGSASNDLILGSNESGGHYGSISIYGEDTKKVFFANKEGTLSVAGKVKSSTTQSADDNTTLTTKDYVEWYVNTAISNGIVGKADATTVATDLTAAVSAAKTELKAHVSEELSKAIAAAKNEVANNMTEAFAEKTNTAPTSGNGNGKYVQSVTQANGQISAVEGTFVNSISSSNTDDAPTSAAVYSHVASHVATEISKIWHSKCATKTSKDNTKYNLQALVLDAVYPKGSIYMQYLSEDDATPTSCPLEATLPGSEWTLIEGGRFLRAVGAAAEGPTVKKGETGGSPDLKLLQHTHKYANDATTVSGGAHQHMLGIKASKTGQDWWEGFEGNCGDTYSGWVIENTIADETELAAMLNKGDTKPLDKGTLKKRFGDHSHNLPSITSAGELTSGTNANLPPYIAVYMWRRTK